MIKILVTGFEPMWRYADINPSWEAVKLLPEKILGAALIKVQTPIVFDKATELLSKSITEVLPDAVICTGQDGRSDGLMIERVGINLDDFGDVPDNAENLLIDQKIIPEGPDAYFCTLPVRAMVANVTKHGIPAYLSETAGTHLCNHVTYFTRHFCANHFPGIISGFIHVPLDIRQIRGDKESMSRVCMDVHDTARGLEHAIVAVVKDLSNRQIS